MGRGESGRSINQFAPMRSILRVVPGSKDGSVWEGLRRGLWIVSVLVAGLSPICLCAVDWPQYRGLQRDGRVAEGGERLESLPEDLKPLWKIKIGGGFASPLVVQGRVVYVDEHEGSEVVHVLEASTGKELWSRAYAPAFDDEWGVGPRCTPVVDSVAGRIYLQSCKGVFRCFRFADGAPVWGFDFEKDYGVHFIGKMEIPEAAARRRGHNGSPILDGDRIVVSVGNTNGASLVCMNGVSGQVIWKSGSDEAGYANLNVGTLAGVRQVVAFTADSLMGVRMEDGEILWRVPIKTAAKRHAVTPVLIGDRVIVSSHTVGLMCFGVAKAEQGGLLSAKPVWSNRDLKISLASLVEVGGFLYGQGPDKNLICVNSADGQLRWSQPGFGDRLLTGYTSTFAVGQRLVALTEQGQLVLIEATPEAYRERGRLQVCGKNWSHPAYVDGVLYGRDSKELFALRIAGPGR